MTISSIFQYVGESEKAVRQVFQRAKNSAPCVIFFDEIDALCPRRSSGSDQSGSNRVVTQMLTEMDGYGSRKGVYIMAATNRQEIVDPAITRPGRLETTLYVGLPDTSERVLILKAITRDGSKPKIASDVIMKDVAELCEGYSGADLKALITKASELAFSEDIAKPELNLTPQVTKVHFNQALKLIRQSVQGNDKARYERMRKKLSAFQDKNTPSLPQNNSEGLKGESKPEKVVHENENCRPASQMLEDVSSNESTIENDTEMDVEPVSPVPEKNDHADESKSPSSTTKKTFDEKSEAKSEVSKSNDKENDDTEYEKTTMRFLFGMKVSIKEGATNEGTKGKVVNQREMIVTIKTDAGNYLTVRMTDLETFMPSPGDNAKLVIRGEPETLFKVLRIDETEEDNVIVKEPNSDRVQSIPLENLCKVE